MATIHITPMTFLNSDVYVTWKLRKVQSEMWRLLPPLHPAPKA